MHAANQPTTFCTHSQLTTSCCLPDHGMLASQPASRTYSVRVMKKPRGKFMIGKVFCNLFNFLLFAEEGAANWT